MPEDIISPPVNLPFNIPDLVGQYNTVYKPERRNPITPEDDYHDIFDSLLSQGTKNSSGEDFSVIPGNQVDMSGRFPLYYVGRDNEDMYAKSQGSAEKAYNGVVKMAGVATSTFINGTAGTVYGIGKAVSDGKFSSFYDNELTNSLNDWTQGLENTYAHYKTERERNGTWWEPSNLFTGNFLWDNVVKNLGFSLGTIAAGFAWGGALKAIGLTGKLMSTGVEMASKADAIISEASLLPQAQRLATINSKLTSLWSSTQSAIGGGLMKADRAIVASFGTIGEAGIESLNNSQQFRQQMINDFISKRGYNPSKQELEEIDSYAESVGNWSYALNTALLTVTNYIQLPKIYSSSFKGEKEILNNIINKEGKYISSLPEQGFGKLLYKTKNVASLFFNTSEAFEEGSQFAIQTGTQNYFGKKYNKQEISPIDDGVLFGIKEALTSNEGTLNIFTGGFSGAMQSSGFLGIKNGMPAIGQTGKIGERGFSGYGGEQGRDRTVAIEALNNSRIKDKFKDAYSNIKASELIQKDREQSIRMGDVLESKDLEFDYAHNFISTRLKYNAKEAIDDEISSLKHEAVTNEGFTKLQQEGNVSPTDTKEFFVRRLDNLQKQANITNSLYDGLNLKYKGIVNQKGDRKYSDDVIDKLVYAGAKITNYDERLPEVATPLILAGINATISFENNEPLESGVKESIDQIDKLDVTLDIKDDLKTNLKDLIELSLRKKLFIEEYDNIKNSPEQYTEIEIPTAIEGEEKETISIKTKDGEEEVNVGEEYFLGRVVEKTEGGKDVYRAPRLTIIGENEDGTIKIKTSNGIVRDIDKKELESYKLGKVSDTLNNKKAKFFMDNWNTVFEFNFGKGTKVKGRLEYSPKEGILNFVYKNKKGDIKIIEVTGDQFIPKKEYTTPMISSVGVLTVEQQKSLEEFSKETDNRIIEKRAARIKILTELFDDLSNKQENTEKLILQKKTE